MQRTSHTSPPLLAPEPQLGGTADFTRSGSLFGGTSKLSLTGTGKLQAVLDVEAAKNACIGIINELEDPKAVKQIEPFMKAASAMRQFVKDPEVQKKGCWAMAYSAVTHSRYVLKAGGLDAVLGAMQQFPGEGWLQAEGCEVLRYLSMDVGGVRKILERGGVNIVSQAMSLHPEDVYVQQNGCGALKNMAARDARAVMAAGGLDMVLQVMEANPGASWVQTWGCQALMHFARVDAKKVDSRDGFAAVSSALRAFGKAEAVVLAAEGALRYRLAP